MPKLRANGLDVHYLQAGQGPDLVLLHGLTGNLAVWHLKLVPLLRHAFRATTYDLRGHGRTSMPPTGYTTGELADDLAHVLDALQIEQADLVGHSLGADVALHFALRWPARVRRLVLIEAGIPALLNDRKHQDWEGWTYWAEMLERYTGARVPAERRNDIAYMVRASLDVPILYGPAAGQPRRKEGILRLLEETTLVRDYEVVGDLTVDALATIPHPKLLAYDEHSPYLGTYRVLHERLANCTSVLLPSGEMRHFAPLEAPDALVEQLTKFLGVAAPAAHAGA